MLIGLTTIGVISLGTDSTAQTTTSTSGNADANGEVCCHLKRKNLGGTKDLIYDYSCLRVGFCVPPKYEPLKNPQKILCAEIPECKQAKEEVCCKRPNGAYHNATTTLLKTSLIDSF